MVKSNVSPGTSSILVERFLALASRYGHYLLAVAIMGALSIMVVPVPPVALDVFIALNIASGVLMLMLSIYIPGALGLSTFPTLIVVTTVLRLSLNIASTKQILLHAHAGSIIETFGRIVMGGSVVVGLVVFSIIAVVQFIVISKGAERVAEVGARFTLDALPGKQMSIEADLRGGFIDKDESRRQRENLQQESQMYGSMDGAMKFVKGDAIAAILIVLVNIIGGISIGVSLLGMSMGEAIARYTLLSIGDGMVSQIPSLLTSVSAGILLTRVAGQEGRSSNLPTQIGVQIMGQPMALFASSGVMALLMVFPGFPKLPFILLAAVFAGMGWRASKRQHAIASAAESATTVKSSRAIAIPLLLRISEGLNKKFSPMALEQELEREKLQLQNDFGLTFPAFQLRFDPELPQDSFAIDVQEIPFVQATFPTDTPTPEAELARQVGFAVRIRPDAFMGTQEITMLIKRVQNQLPDLHEELFRSMPLQRIIEVLRRLALEGVSLRYMREIYESLLTWAAREKDTAMLCEHVRVELGRFICHTLLDEQRSLSAITLETHVEASLREYIQQGPNGAYLSMPPEMVGELVQAVRSAVASLPSNMLPVVLTTMETRRFLRRLIAQTLPQLRILSYQEVPPDVQIQSVGRIALPQPGSLPVERK